MMSELLEWVTSWSLLTESHRIDPHVLCKGSWRDEEFWFTVTDDGWYGWFIAQYQGELSREQLDEAAHLIRRIGTRRAHFFHFDWNDETRLVRGVFQLPIANEPRWEDDVPVAVRTLKEEWGTLLPFLRRIPAGETAEAMLAEAKKAFEEINARHPKVELPEILTRADPWART
jgi:hypothetical protein